MPHYYGVPSGVMLAWLVAVVVAAAAAAFWGHKPEIRLLLVTFGAVLMEAALAGSWQTVK